ncbi:phage tail protein [Kitasatospora purpeofusca]|uniref:phage distal tail protein n=1 Tax=Kitasatospora purpeofusca TaxID=67352 RepID=UPI0035E08D9F
MAGELISTDGQIEWRGLLLGERSPYAGRVLAGWDSLPDLDDASALRAQQHGAWPGRLLARQRVLTWDAELIPEDPAQDAQWPDLLAQLRAATGVRQDEQPLVVRLAGQTLQVGARITARTIPSDQQYTAGHPQISLEWTCSDPLRYSLAETSADTLLPQPGQGLDWGDGASPPGLDWYDGSSPPGLDWGTPGSSGDLTVTNEGDAETPPRIEFRGPVTRPSVRLRETGQVLEYDLVLAAADVLTVDTSDGTVTLASGASRLYTVTPRSVPEQTFVLPPGASTLSFRDGPGTTGTAASMTVRYRSAYW